MSSELSKLPGERVRPLNGNMHELQYLVALFRNLARDSGNMADRCKVSNSMMAREFQAMKMTWEQAATIVEERLAPDGSRGIAPDITRQSLFIQRLLSMMATVPQEMWEAPTLEQITGEADG